MDMSNFHGYHIAAGLWVRVVFEQASLMLSIFRLSVLGLL